MRVSDYIFKFLADYGIEHVFLVTGGGAMHLNDALKKESRIKFFCNYLVFEDLLNTRSYSNINQYLTIKIG